MYKRVPDYIRTLKPYVAGKHIETVEREYGFKGPVKLASNENPLGPSPLALEVLQREVHNAHRYPDASAYQLKKEIAEKHQIPPELVVIGNGSNDVVDMIIRTCCQPGDAVATSEGAFIAYKICAQIHGVRTVSTPLTQDLRFDLRALLKAVQNDSKVSAVFIPNPNNPTGTYVAESELTWFLNELQDVRGDSVLAVLDYAYWEYVRASDLPDPHKIGKAFPSVMVLHTFSKVYGLAGLRLGYGVGPAEFISYMERIRQPFNGNHLALEAARAALHDKAFVKKSVELNTLELQYWSGELLRLKIPFLPSQGNFLLLDIERGMNQTGQAVFEKALTKGVIFRPVANYGFPSMLRVSMGTREENRIAVRVLEEIKRDS